ncbi:MAG TPA: NDP-sugar synthase [Thermoanaerobaculia bacterium]|nr:NDP-sugar synthase [Thermoanaerobaculia bacterium]
MRALVLAAGYGTRLRPLTDELPKPLLPVLGRPLLLRTLDALVDAGCEAAAINLHHLAEAIPAAVGDEHRGMRIVYSREEPILGTGGAFVPLRDFFAGSETALLVNGDSLCEWPLGELLARHRRRGAAATLLLAGRPDPRSFGGGIGIDRNGRVRAIRREPTFGPVVRRFVYAGAYALDPALLARLPEGFSDSMRDLFEPLLAEGGRIESLVTWKPWHDLGTPARYLEAMLDLSARADAGWKSSEASIAANADLRRVVVESGVRVEAGAAVEDSLLLPGAVVRAGSRLRRVVVGPEAELPAGSAWSEALLTRWRPDATLPAGSRRDADLIVTPFAG